MGVHLIGMHLTGVHLMGMHLTLHLMGGVPHERARHACVS
jgi:hypothetical protein